MVLDWNATADNVTMSFNMGFVRIQEDSSAGAGSVDLDMLLKFGLLQYNNNESWELAHDVGTSGLYSFGDHKSNENCTALIAVRRKYYLVRSLDYFSEIHSTNTILDNNSGMAI